MPYDRTEHIIGYGKRLSYCATANGTFIEVWGTIDVKLPERELGKSDLTNDDSADYHKDYIPGMYEPGTVSFTYRYGRTLFAQLETVFQLANTTATRLSANKFWKVRLPDGSVAAFTGFITKHDLPVEGQEDSPVVEGEIQVTGKVVFTAGSGS